MLVYELLDLFIAFAVVMTSTLVDLNRHRNPTRCSWVILKVDVVKVLQTDAFSNHGTLNLLELFVFDFVKIVLHVIHRTLSLLKLFNLRRYRISFDSPAKLTYNDVQVTIKVIQNKLFLVEHAESKVEI